MSEQKYREELIHTMAVILSALECFDYGKAGASQRGRLILIEELLKERDRQDGLWGQVHHEPEIWIKIITEELGEAAEELLSSDLLARVETEGVRGEDSVLVYVVSAGRRCKRELG